MNEEQFTAQIIRVIEKNGFPGHHVSLPLESLYESAYKHGLNLNQILENLTNDGVCHEKTTDKIIFSPASEGTNTHLSGIASKLQGLDPSIIDTLKNGIDPSKNMFEQISSMASKLSPEQLASLSNLYAGLSDSEKATMKDYADKQV